MQMSGPDAAIAAMLTTDDSTAHDITALRIIRAAINALPPKIKNPGLAYSKCARKSDSQLLSR